MQHLSMLRSANSFRLTPWFSHSELSPSVSVTVWILVEVKWGFTEVLRVGRDCKGGWRKCITEFGLSLEPYGIASSVLYLYIYIYIKPWNCKGKGTLPHFPGPIIRKIQISESLKWIWEMLAPTNGRHTTLLINPYCPENPLICCCVSCCTSFAVLIHKYIVKSQTVWRNSQF